MRNLNESRAIRLQSIVISQIKENHTNVEDYLGVAHRAAVAEDGEPLSQPLAGLITAAQICDP